MFETLPVVSNLPARFSLDFGLALIRIIVGALFVGHGLQKLFGWFGGPGLKGVTGRLGQLGIRPAGVWAVALALAETLGGLSLALGLLTPIGAVALLGVMIVAVALVHWRKGLWATQGGFEYNLVLGAVALAAGLTGGGRYTLDALYGWLPASPVELCLLSLVPLAIALIMLAVTIRKGKSTTDAARPAQPQPA